LVSLCWWVRSEERNTRGDCRPSILGELQRVSESHQKAKDVGTRNRALDRLHANEVIIKANPPRTIIELTNHILPDFYRALYTENNSFDSTARGRFNHRPRQSHHLRFSHRRPSILQAQQKPQIMSIHISIWLAMRSEIITLFAIRRSIFPQTFSVDREDVLIPRVQIGGVADRGCCSRPPPRPVQEEIDAHQSQRKRRRNRDRGPKREQMEGTPVPYSLPSDAMKEGVGRISGISSPTPSSTAAT